MTQDEVTQIVLEILPRDRWRLLEIGSGSGHHAVRIAAKLPDLQWVTSDTAHRQNAIKKTLQEAKLPNVHGPLEFEVGKDDFPTQKFNAAFAAHVLQVISWKQAKSLFKVLGNRLRQGSQVIFVGPFKYDGRFISEHAEAADKLLKGKDPQHGIRAFDDVVKAMSKAGFALKRDHALANENHLLFFERLAHTKE